MLSHVWQFIVWKTPLARYYRWRACEIAGDAAVEQMLIDLAKEDPSLNLEDLKREHLPKSWWRPWRK
jgi:hypothetical protein